MSRPDAQEHLELAWEKLNVAQELQRAGHDRDAASRAYYAMYHAAYALARLRGAAPRTHRGLAAVLADLWVRSGELDVDLWTDLRRAQEVRELGDYGSTFGLTSEEVEILVERAATFVGRAAELVQGDG